MSVINRVSDRIHRIYVIKSIGFVVQILLIMSVVSSDFGETSYEQFSIQQ